MCCISKILKNESNSQPQNLQGKTQWSCVVSQRYWKMKAIHNLNDLIDYGFIVVLYLKDTEKWKQFTTMQIDFTKTRRLCCISKILKNESNSQHPIFYKGLLNRCVVSQRYWKMKAIHNMLLLQWKIWFVVLYLKDTEKWKQFTTRKVNWCFRFWLCCISKILKNESNSQLLDKFLFAEVSCVVSQRYWKMKAIHNILNSIC